MRPSYDQLALVFDALPDPIMLIDVEGDELRVASVNAAVCRIVGAAADAIVGKTIVELFGAAVEGPRYIESCRVAVRERRIVRYERHGELREQPIALQITLTPLLRDGQCVQLVSAAQDIAEQTRAVTELRALFEYAPEAIVTFDLAEQRFVEANARACELFEATAAELCLLGPADVSPELQPDGSRSAETLKIHGMATAPGAVNAFEWVHRTVKGRLLPCEVRLVRLPGTRVRATVIDISDRREADALRLQTAGLLEQKRVAEAESRVKSQLVANLSHELRTPLNAILGFAELLHDGHVGPLDAEQIGCLADILSSGRHLLGLISGVLDLAKGEAGHMEMKPTRTAIRALVTEATELVRPLAAQKAITIEVLIDPFLHDVVVDGARLKQVMLNFLSNALKFTKEGGRIWLRANGDGAMFRIAVEDTGIGISAADIPKLFVEFTQLETGADRRHEGTGLGLALCKRIVELQGGSVGVESIIGMGSRFWALLPRGDVDAR